MKKIIVLLLSVTLLFSLTACDFIEEQIRKEMDRIESIQFTDFEINIPERSILVKITSNVDEQIIEEVSVNGERLRLIAQGDDWYLLDNIPIEKQYTITNVYYRSGFGPLVPFNINYEITLNEALQYLPEGKLIEIDDTLEIEGFTFSLHEEVLISITSDLDYTVEELADWVWIIFEAEKPVFVVFENESIVYLISVPEEVESFIE